MPPLSGIILLLLPTVSLLFIAKHTRQGFWQHLAAFSLGQFPAHLLANLYFTFILHEGSFEIDFGLGLAETAAITVIGNVILWLSMILVDTRRSSPPRSPWLSVGAGF